jgi:hypothetical protein
MLLCTSCGNLDGPGPAAAVAMLRIAVCASGSMRARSEGSTRVQAVAAPRRKGHRPGSFETMPAWKPSARPGGGKADELSQTQPLQRLPNREAVTADVLHAEWCGPEHSAGVRATFRCILRPPIRIASSRPQGRVQSAWRLDSSTGRWNGDRPTPGPVALNLPSLDHPISPPSPTLAPRRLAH